MNIYELQKTRRSIRKFSDEKIEYKLLEKFIDYARLSSSMKKCPTTK